MVTAINGRQVTFRIAEPFNGLDPKRQEIVIETGLGGGDCGYPFTRGRDYIVYASKDPNGALSTGICSPTRALVDAAEDLAYFHQLPKAQSTSEVRVLAYNPLGNWSPIPALAGVRLTLTGPNVRQQAVTDSSGRHTFAGLPPAEYRVESSLQGYVVNYPVPAAKAPAKGCVVVELPFRLDRVVMGTVVHKDGRPAAGINVEAVNAGQPSAADLAVTDAAGHYRLNNLRAGDYQVGVSLASPPTLRQPYDRTVAGVVQVVDTPGTIRLDFTLPEPRRERLIRGVVLWPDGSPVEKGNVSLEDPRWPNRMTVFATTGADGRFTLQALDATRYRVFANGMRNRTPAFSEPAPVEPGAAPLDLRIVLTRASPVRAAAPPR